MPKFAVAIAVYNKETHIAQTLQSVLDQTFTNFEVVIVNDGSTDASETEIQQFSDQRIQYSYQENKGAGAARNAAIAQTTAPWIALLDADDHWEPNYLSEINDLIEKHQDHKVFATAIAIEKSGVTVESVYSIPNLKQGETKEVNFFEASSINSILTSSSTVLHRSVLEDVGMYDPRIKSGQDTDLWIRVGLAYPILFLNKSLATYRLEPQSLSNTTFNVSDKATFEAYESLEANNPALKKFLDLNRFSLAILAKLGNDREAFRRNYNKIELSNLNRKQRFLLKAPAYLVKKLHRLKTYFEGRGIYLTAFS
ncbi:MAG: glycosyltransferase family 2 protein [Flavobacteriales bacterium]|jgi:glycosyltransferase involved in cell wall biosynthesis|uniref:glycosyltransferase family 2 protein n=1 Tax=Candidatus Ulvibacter alkanivorans TaxID=2267620 RepID=UPI000DF32F3E|nr:glycosyltransferase family A protein [Candidatus Ulvibacter alkanivorans]MCH2491039.1 glycosyltransferase family 2 protein [Flavobacteriales bacterium]